MTVAATRKIPTAPRCSDPLASSGARLRNSCPTVIPTRKTHATPKTLDHPGPLTGRAGGLRVVGPWTWPTREMSLTRLPPEQASQKIPPSRRYLQRHHTKRSERKKSAQARRIVSRSSMYTLSTPFGPLRINPSDSPRFFLSRARALTNGSNGISTLPNPW